MTVIYFLLIKHQEATYALYIHRIRFVRVHILNSLNFFLILHKLFYDFLD